MEAFSAGTLAGAGSFRCDSCGYAVALHERGCLSHLGLHTERVKRLQELAAIDAVGRAAQRRRGEPGRG